MAPIREIDVTPYEVGIVEKESEDDELEDSFYDFTQEDITNLSHYSFLQNGGW